MHGIVLCECTEKIRAGKMDRISKKSTVQAYFSIKQRLVGMYTKIVVYFFVLVCRAAGKLPVGFLSCNGIALIIMLLMKHRFWSLFQINEITDETFKLSIRRRYS